MGFYQDEISPTRCKKRYPEAWGDVIKITVLLLALLMVGCTALSNLKKQGDFKVTAEEYARTVRWLDFETANEFRKYTKTEKIPPNFKRLRRVKVTSYEVRQSTPLIGNTRVRQIVDIRYYKTDEMIERSLRDDQLWQYDARDDRWYLWSGLPDFK